ncbi:MAG: exodeoxyribonuclease III [bacterium]
MSEAQVRVYSWNVNGLRAVGQKGFLDWLGGLNRAIVGLQEVRAEPHQLDDDLRQPTGWFTHIQPAKKKGYSGVGLYSEYQPDAFATALGVDHFDDEGRVQILTFGALEVWNVYFPNGNGKDRDLSRIPYKLEFYQHIRERLDARVQAGGRILMMGDFNTAHQEIDLARPKDNVKTSGFRPEEREEFQRWIDSGWVDTFRQHHGEVEGRYSWWSQRKGIRERNVGWRIDYVLASPAASEFVRFADIHHDVMGSDHCPVSVDLDVSIFGEGYVLDAVSNPRSAKK